MERENQFFYLKNPLYSDGKYMALMNGKRIDLDICEDSTGKQYSMSIEDIDTNMFDSLSRNFKNHKITEEAFKTAYNNYLSKFQNKFN